MDEPDPIGYVVALPPECRTLTPRRARRGDILPFDRTHWIAIAGAGIDNAGAAAEALVNRGARRLVSWGCAAALADDLAPGDLVVPAEVVYADGSTVSLASPWYERVVGQLRSRIPVRTGRLAESATIVGTDDEKRRLHRVTGAVATDMETGAVARTAEQYGLPCLTIRSIVDTASVTLPRAAQAALDGNGEIVVTRLLLQLARRPSDIGPMCRLAGAFRAAMQTLAVVAAHAGPTLDPR